MFSHLILKKKKKIWGPQNRYKMHATIRRSKMELSNRTKNGYF